jgi:hypothetical protein
VLIQMSSSEKVLKMSASTERWRLIRFSCRRYHVNTAVSISRDLGQRGNFVFREAFAPYLRLHRTCRFASIMVRDLNQGMLASAHWHPVLAGKETTRSKELLVVIERQTLADSSSQPTMGMTCHNVTVARRLLMEMTLSSTWRETTISGFLRMSKRRSVGLAKQRFGSSLASLALGDTWGSCGCSWCSSISEINFWVYFSNV